MDNEVRSYIEKLISARQRHCDNIAEAEKNGTEVGHWESIIGKYSDSSHFVYEVIQNADDVGATWAKFELYTDRLVFRHNGTVLFTVSNPDTYETDKLNGLVGHVNAITAIGASNKADDKATIGKFGVGFKAVFQITNTPIIYDDNIAFMIKNYIVPELLDDDYPGREKGETVFVFPFNREDVGFSVYKKVATKLCTLIFPNLFLTHLKTIQYRIGNDEGTYKVEELYVEQGCQMDFRHLNVIKGNEKKREELYFFSRIVENQYKISVGFFVDSEGHVRKSNRRYNAFCFFPTLVSTNLEFIIHAPFLLTDSREGIKSDEAHNKKMINYLAYLAADAIEWLCRFGERINVKIIDDEIIGVLPIEETSFIVEENENRPSFLSFYKTILQRMQTAKVIPTRDGYTSKRYACWADNTELSALLSDSQLRMLLGSEYHWVFLTKGRNSLNHPGTKTMFSYIDGLTARSLNDFQFYREITTNFIEKQDKSWLLNLYNSIVESRNLRAKIEGIRNVPIFWDLNEKAVAAYNLDNNPTLFLPLEEMDSSGFTTINPDLYSDEGCKKLLSELSIGKPDDRSVIYSKILPKYVDGEKNGPTKGDFRVFLKYYIKLCQNGKFNDASRFASDISNCRFIAGVSGDGSAEYVCKGNELYFNTPELRMYFNSNKDVFFFNDSEYDGYISKSDKNYLTEFLKSVGVSEYVRRYIMQYGYYERQEVGKIFSIDSSWWEKGTLSKRKQFFWEDYRLAYCKGVLTRIEQEQSIDLSRIMWEQLCELFKNAIMEPVLGGVYHYFSYGNQVQYFPGLDQKSFTTVRWIRTIDGQFMAPKGLVLTKLDEVYNLTKVDGRLLHYLGILKIDPNYENLSEEQIRKIKFAEKLEQCGLSDANDDELIKVREFISHMRNKDTDRGMDSNNSENKQNAEDLATLDENDSQSHKVMKDINEKVIRNRVMSVTDEDDTPKVIPEVESDDYTRVVVDYSVKIEETKEKCAHEIQLLEQQQEAQNKVMNSKKYSYGWFLALLELEAMANGENNIGSREVSIVFGRVCKDDSSSRTIVLRQPNKSIPQVVEELVDVPLNIIYLDGTTKKVIIDGCNIQSYALRVKVKSEEQVNQIDFNSVKEARIDTKNPSFLLRELQNQFAMFNFDMDKNLREDMCSNIKFVFGPPGTGKTTYIARDVIADIMKSNAQSRVIVLAPTNKAADVVVDRVADIWSDDTYKDWLIRYGVTADEKIEERGLFYNKETDISKFEKYVVATTISRFPYDYFITPDNHRVYLRDIDWDYVIIDEASMIPLIYTIYTIYKSTPVKFIIAGDPFQIEPTFSVSGWEDENIYKMVNLNSFTSPQVIPHDFEIELLTKQYRSVPSVGRIFSKLTYGGVLDHARDEKSKRILNIEKYLSVESLNIIKFPVSRYESIFSAKRLKGSNYQVYSAIFTFEFIRFLACKLEFANPGEKYNVGVISPYKAQIGIIDKLVASEIKMHNLDVNCGTIHGFQGDECDIVIAVFNPPPRLSNDDKILLNKKNILNVAISRARDYLFVIMPDDDTFNISNCVLLKRMEELIKSEANYTELNSHDVERLIFGDADYINSNSFASGHQMVNVYGKPEKKYEIRSEDLAVDVQIHEK